jgi:SAM-dependent methyltransferase
MVEHLQGWANLVVCSEVLEHVDEPARLLRAGLRHAAPGARVVITVPAGPRTAFDRHIGHRQHFNRSGLEVVMRTSGLVDIQIEAAGMPFFNLYRLVVFARGDRLIDEMSSGGSGTESRLGKLVLRFFDVTLPLSRRRGRLGWQLVAVASVPSQRQEVVER